MSPRLFVAVTVSTKATEAHLLPNSARAHTHTHPLILSTRAHAPLLIVGITRACAQRPIHPRVYRGASARGSERKGLRARTRAQSTFVRARPAFPTVIFFRPRWQTAREARTTSSLRRRHFARRRAREIHAAVVKSIRDTTAGP